MNLFSVFGRARAPVPTAQPAPSRWPRCRFRVTVRPTVEPYWKFRRWTKKGGRLQGAYRTPRGSYLGEIRLSRGGLPKYYIFNPPRALLTGAHGACFGPDTSKGKYWVHFRHHPFNDVDGGIVEIERYLLEALGGPVPVRRTRYA
jgi:hypothetical protein